MINILEITASILAIFIFLLLIISKCIQYHKVNMKDKTVIRNYINGEFYSHQITLNEGNDSLIIYNNEENIFDIEFYKLSYDFNTNKYIRYSKFNVPNIKKLVKGEPIVIKTNIPDVIPDLEVCWKTIAGEKISVIVYYNGRDGLTLSNIEYQKNPLVFLYYFFK